MSPRARVLYLLATSVGVFWIQQPAWLAAFAALQGALWLAVGLSFSALRRQLVKLWVFAALITASFAFSPLDPATDRWLAIPLGPWSPSVNTDGLGAGALMVLRIVAVILSSQVARAGNPQAISVGLRGLGLPSAAALTLDTVLSLLGSSDRGGARGTGRGDRSGSGRQSASDAGPRRGFLETVRGIARGESLSLRSRLERQIEQAQQHTARHIEGDSPAPDAGAVAGIALTMLGVRALKVLPSIPFAPGHKLVILTPLYVAAALLTRGRCGSTLTGASMGTASFLLGDGRYGIFEVAKHVAPGIVCDLGVPLIVRGGSSGGRVVWSIFGGIVAAARFATILAMTGLVAAPAVAYAILVPGLLVHVGFGVVSGYVTYPLVRELLEGERATRDGVRNDNGEPSPG